MTTDMKDYLEMGVLIEISGNIGTFIFKTEEVELRCDETLVHQARMFLLNGLRKVLPTTENRNFNDTAFF